MLAKKNAAAQRDITDGAAVPAALALAMAMAMAMAAPC